MEYTIEIFKIDRRRKEGTRKIKTVEIDVPDRACAEAVAAQMTKGVAKTTFAIHKTFVEVTNILTGAKVMERYDTPRHCSVSSEAYFSM